MPKKCHSSTKGVFPFCQALMKMISCLGALSSGMSNTLPPNEKKVLEQVNKDGVIGVHCKLCVSSTYNCNTKANE